MPDEENKPCAATDIYADATLNITADWRHG
jgi:hypothetical protein